VLRPGTDTSAHSADGCTDGCTDGYTNECCTYVGTDVSADGCTDLSANDCTDGIADGCTHGCTDKGSDPAPVRAWQSWL
jgi:hypothetical protein